MRNDDTFEAFQQAEKKLTAEKMLSIIEKTQATGKRQLVLGLCRGPCKTCGRETGWFWDLPNGSGEWECKSCSGG